MAKEIQIRCESGATLDFEKIQPFQGELKTLTEEGYQKLRSLILANGITAPILVWKESTSKIWNLDGHQRQRVLSVLRKEGFKVPKVPVVYVEAKSRKQAKEILLSNVAQFGKVEQDGLYEFMHDAAIDFAALELSFELPGFNLARFGKAYFEDADGDEDADKKLRSSSGKVKKVALEFDDQSHQDFLGICEDLSELYEKDSITDIVLTALRDVHRRLHEKKKPSR